MKGENNMKKILNLTQHIATPEQKDQGVYDLSEGKQKTLKELLTFEKLPTCEEIEVRAKAIAEIAVYEAQDTDEVMIGGAPYLMYPLIRALAKVGLSAVFAFSEREVVEESQADGSVKKISVFKHKGFVPAV